jgi:hypothetical protein
VRALFDEHNEPIAEAGPSTPVVLTGLDVVPEAGERFVVLDNVSGIYSTLKATGLWLTTVVQTPSIETLCPFRSFQFLGFPIRT